MSVSTEASVSMGNAVGLYVEMGVERVFSCFRYALLELCAFSYVEV